MSILLYGCTTWTLTKFMKKSLMAITQEWCEPYGTRLKTAAIQPPTTHQENKLDKPDMWDTTGEVRTSS